MNSEGQNDHGRENDHLVEPMYGGLEVAREPRRRPPLWPFLTGIALGTVLLLVWLLVFRA